MGVVGAIVPWNFPFEVDHPQAWPGAGHRQHGRAQARARHPVQRHPVRTHDRRVDGRPRRRRQRRHRIRSPGRGRAHTLAAGRPDLVHRLHRRRKADHGKGRVDDEAAVPRAGRQVSNHRAGGRRLRLGVHDRHRAVYARRPGLRDADADAAAAIPLRRRRRDPESHLRHRRSRATRRTRRRCAAR